MNPPTAVPPDPSGLDSVIARNIQALIERRADENRRRPWSVRLSDGITGFTGSMRFVLLHVVIFGTWIIINLPFTLFPKFDPSFVVLAMVASVEAIFLSTFVLISQNRMAGLADRRAELDLQISLLTEHEITRLVHLVDAMAAHVGVADAHRAHLDEIKRDVRPEAVLDELERPPATPASPADSPAT